MSFRKRNVLVPYNPLKGRIFFQLLAACPPLVSSSAKCSHITCLPFGCFLPRLWILCAAPVVSLPFTASFHGSFSTFCPFRFEVVLNHSPLRRLKPILFNHFSQTDLRREILTY